MPVVDRLYQQGPVVFAQVIVAFEGTVTDLPFSILMADKAAIDLALHGQSSQFVRAQRVDKIGEAALQYHRPFLPVAFDKVGPVKR